MLPRAVTDFLHGELECWHEFGPGPDTLIADRASIPLIGWHAGRKSDHYSGRGDNTLYQNPARQRAALQVALTLAYAGEIDMALGVTANVERDLGTDAPRDMLAFMNYANAEIIDEELVMNGSNRYAAGERRGKRAAAEALWQAAEQAQEPVDAELREANRLALEQLGSGPRNIDAIVVNSSYL